MVEKSNAAKTAVGGLAAVTGVITGAGVALLTQEPLVSSAIGAGLGSVIDDFGRRVLSWRERHRIETVVSSAAEWIGDFYRAGVDFRDDGFFDADPNNRSMFEEIAEGVLVSAQREHEERKIPHLGYMIANIAIDDGIGRGTANWAIRTATELSWTQFVLLAIVASDIRTLPSIEIGSSSESWERWSADQELQNLGYGERHLIAAPSLRTPRGYPVPNLDASEQTPHVGGGLLVHLLGLSEVPLADLDGVLRLWPSQPAPSE